MKRYIKSYDTSTESFNTVVKEVLIDIKDHNALRNYALMDIISNTLAAASYDLGLDFEIDDMNFTLDGNNDIKSSYTYYASIYKFSIDEEKHTPQFMELSPVEKRKVEEYLESTLRLPDRTDEEQYRLDVEFYYSLNLARPRIEISVHKQMNF